LCDGTHKSHFAIYLCVLQFGGGYFGGRRGRGCMSAKIHQSPEVQWSVKISFRKYWVNLLTEILFDNDGQRWTTFLSFQIWSSIIFLKAEEEVCFVPASSPWLNEKRPQYKVWKRQG